MNIVVAWPFRCPRFVNSRLLLVLLVFILGSGCTRVELGNKAEAYNHAIGDSNNGLVLLNAVRASQRAPMAFTGLGDVSATPTFSGSAQGTANFDPFHLTTYSLNPQVNVGGGFTSFAMTNLNSTEFMEKMQRSVDYNLILFFEKLNWPEELITLLFVSSYQINGDFYIKLEAQAEAICNASPDKRSQQICGIIHEDDPEYSAADCRGPDLKPTMELLNTARDVCGMVNFQRFVRRLRLVHEKTLDLRAHARRFGYKSRSAQGMLYYLGELIAAQNYSTAQYTPRTLIRTGTGEHFSVPLFVVRRGVPNVLETAVSAQYGGETFFIPRPELGTFAEARSLQVLDFVTQVIAAQTSSKQLPTVNTLGVVVSR